MPGKQEAWRRLCLKAFENLLSDTTVTMDDVDSILTWCMPLHLIPSTEVVEIEEDAARVTALRIVAGRHPDWDEVAALAEAYVTLTQGERALRFGCSAVPLVPAMPRCPSRRVPALSCAGAGNQVGTRPVAPEDNHRNP